MQALEFIHPMDRDRLCDGGCAPSALSRVRLDQVAMALHAATTVTEVFDALVLQLADDVPFDRLGLAFLSADGDRVVSRRVFSRQPLLVWRPGESRSLMGSSLSPLLEEGSVRIIHDLQAYQQLRPSSEPTKRLIEEGMRSSLTLPLYHDGAPLGFLFFTSRGLQTYGPRHVAIASRMAPVIGQALGRALEHEVRGPEPRPRPEAAPACSRVAPA